MKSKELEETKEYLKEFSKLMKKWEATEIASNIDIALNYIENSISKEVIKDKLDNIQKRYEKSVAKIDREDLLHTSMTTFRGIQLESQRNILRELLEGK